MPAMKNAVYAGAKEQPVYDVQTMQEIDSRSMLAQRLPMILIGGFAGFLLLASIGIYGVVAYSVAQRVHEIGIRMALGAEQGEVLRLGLRQGARMAFLGVAIGLSLHSGLPVSWRRSSSESAHTPAYPRQCRRSIGPGCTRSVLRPSTPGDEGRSDGGAVV